MSRSEYLNLPVSITSWILLRHYIRNHGDLEMYKKVLSEYQAFCPLSEIERIMAAARELFEAEELEELLDAMFSAYHFCSQI